MRDLPAPSQRPRQLNKNDVETLLRNYDTNPVLALTTALQIVLGLPFGSWSDLILAMPIANSRQHHLIAHDPHHLDQLVKELNELRGLNFILQ